MTKDTETPKATTPATAKTLSHNPWSLIEPGATVLYCEARGEGWWPCTVKGKSDDGKFLQLKWKDGAGLPEFKAKTVDVGLICKVK